MAYSVSQNYYIKELLNKQMHRTRLRETHFEDWLNNCVETLLPGRLCSHYWTERAPFSIVALGKRVASRQKETLNPIMWTNRMASRSTRAEHLIL